MRRRGALCLCGVIVHVLLLGCGAMRPFDPTETVRPQTPPVRNITSFTPALRCMDHLFATHGYGPQGNGGTAFVTGEGIVDKTGKGIGGDNVDVLMATISRLAAESGAYTFVRYNPRKLTLEELQRLSILHGGLGNVTWPRYEISGAITQLDENVDARSLSLSVVLFGGDLGGSKDLRATVVSVDVNVSDAISGQMVNGLTASNTMAIKRQGKALDGGGAIQKVGLFFNVSLDQNEGVYAALRALIELSTIEVLGKLAKVPYWQCLQIEHSNPEVLSMTRDWFASMPVEERVSFVQRILKQSGYYNGAATGTLDKATQDAIARYQAVADLIPSGRIDLDLYRRLIGPQQPARVIAEPTGRDRVGQGQTARRAAARLVLTLTTPRGTTPVYAVNEHLSVSVQVSEEAYVSCYYRSGKQVISRLYPNRFQKQARVQANQVITIPATAPFALVLDTPNTTEDILCLASREALEARLPSHLRPDLEVLPVAQLEEIRAVFRQLAPDSLAEAQLQVQVSAPPGSQGRL